MQPLEARRALRFGLVVEARDLLAEALLGPDAPGRLDLDGEPLGILVHDRLQQLPEAPLEPDLDQALGRAADDADEERLLVLEVAEDRTP